MNRDYYGLTDAAIAQLMGERLRALRLRRNRTVQSVMEATGLSERTVLALEHGRGKLENLIAVLRALRALEGLDAFLPEPVASPLALAKREGKVRLRASGTRKSPRIPVSRDRGEKW